MNKKNVVAIIGLLLFFIVPIVAAFWFIQHPQKWALKTVNHGQLLQPLLDTKAWSLPASGQWRLLYLQPQAQCAENCQRTLYDLRQVRLALGKNQDRVVRIYGGIGVPLSAETRRLLTVPFKGTQSVEISTTALKAVLSGVLTQRVLSRGLLLIVDPQDHAMMVYDVGFSAKDALADLNRLLMVN